MENQNPPINQTPPVQSQPIQDSNISQSQPIQPVSFIPPNFFLSNKIILLVIAVLVLILAGGGTYLALNSKPQSKPAPPTTPKPAPVNQSTIPSTTLSPSASISPINIPGYYEDKNAGFSFKYPQGVVYVDWNLIRKDYRTSVFTEKLKDSNIASLHEQYKYAIEQEKALANNQPVEVGFAIKGYSKVISLGKVNGVSSIILGEWDTCSVMFKHELTFFNNGYQINVLLYGPEDKIVSEMPQYFDKPPKEASGCGGGGVPYMWNMDGNTSQSTAISQFLEVLKAGKGSTSAQTWFDDFDKVVSSITIN